MCTQCYVYTYALSDPRIFYCFMIPSLLWTLIRRGQFTNFWLLSHNLRGWTDPREHRSWLFPPTWPILSFLLHIWKLALTLNGLHIGCLLKLFAFHCKVENNVWGWLCNSWEGRKKTSPPQPKYCHWTLPRSTSPSQKCAGLLEILLDIGCCLGMRQPSSLLLME